MKRLITVIVGAFILTACNPVDYVTDRAANAAAEECQEMLDEELPKVESAVWSMCTNYYEQVVIPYLKLELQQLLDNLREEMDRLLAEAEIEAMTRMGCVETNANPSGWDCTDTWVCDQ
jgi:hypothetical protein